LFPRHLAGHVFPSKTLITHIVQPAKQTIHIREISAFSNPLTQMTLLMSMWL